MSSSGPKSQPRDAKAIVAMLKELNVTDFDPRVIAQLLEFSYRYVAELLDDSRVYADFAQKKQIDADDIRLAIRLKSAVAFSNPPPREMTMEIAKEKNSIPLPPLRPVFGLRLPHERHCLYQPNIRTKTAVESSGKTPMSAGGSGRHSGPSRVHSAASLSSAPVFFQRPNISSTARKSSASSSVPNSPAVVPSGDSSQSAAASGPPKSLFRVVSAAADAKSDAKRKFDEIDEDYDRL